MSDQFPRTAVAGVSLPRMIIGSNWLFGFSHTSRAADQMITHKFSTKESLFPIFETFLGAGVDAFMGCVSQTPLELEAIRYAEDKLGRKIIIIDTPIVNMNDTAEGRREAEATMKASAQCGSDFTLIHHSCAEQLVNKNTGTMDRLPDYTKMIRDVGTIPGLSAHMPELILYSDANGYDVETYIQLYNCMGFLMQIEVESVARIIHGAKKPVMTIKPFAAGRTTPYIGLNFVYNTIRECDMVTVGVNSELEAAEDIEIGLAAIERRLPDLEARGSVAKQDVLK